MTAHSDLGASNLSAPATITTLPAEAPRTPVPYSAPWLFPTGA